MPQALAVLAVVALSLLVNRLERLEPVGKVMLGEAIPVALAVAVVVVPLPQVAVAAQAMAAMAALPLQVLSPALQRNMLAAAAAAVTQEHLPELAAVAALEMAALALDQTQIPAVAH